VQEVCAKSAVKAGVVDVGYVGFWGRSVVVLVRRFVAGVGHDATVRVRSNGIEECVAG